MLDGLVAKGEPDAIAAVITADGVWAGAAGVDGPKARAARANDEFGMASDPLAWGICGGQRCAEPGAMGMAVVLGSDHRGPHSGAMIGAVDEEDYGLGIERFSDFAPEAYGHSGSQTGYGALLAVFPERQVVVLPFINREGPDTVAGGRRLVAAIDH